MLVMAKGDPPTVTVAISMYCIVPVFFSKSLLCKIVIALESEPIVSVEMSQ